MFTRLIVSENCLGVNTKNALKNAGEYRAPIFVPVCTGLYTDSAAVGTNYWFVWLEENCPPPRLSLVSHKVFFFSVLSPMEFGFLWLAKL